MPSDKKMSMVKASEWEAFIALVWEQGRAHERNNLPWRNIDDPYAVWISEAMLQQTQVNRVLNYWPKWVSMFPSVDALASASTSDVLECWQGLGYNRRALALKRAADILSRDWQGCMPYEYDDLVSLPGIGPATAAGILVFAYQKPAVYLETNVRAVFIHHFFSQRNDVVRDKELLPYVQRASETHDPRGWNYALLDYGHYLKKVVANPTRKAAAYTKQSAFEGSNRQKRSFIVREVLACPGIDAQALQDALNEREEAAGRSAVDQDTFDLLVEALCKEGFFHIRDGKLIP